ncbi:sucrose-6-phosphate hydrolase [uncultured Enterococcus sp.]|uniref:sucrose-6-phosphate hydrolase n=1 Tax=uncultured Enterococcus sp. TaxID=167972 RepID=UPI0025ADF5E6|nr:sucrose-6-phosphate hydrolase [uncultured Enterococcus sp.]
MKLKENWSRTDRYRPYKEWSEEHLHSLEKKINSSHWRLGYHIQPVTGLLNDPNGFSYFDGKWQLFYQAYPMGSVHGLKSWYHLSSVNLIDWKNDGLKLIPDNSFDSHGVYSGSALPIDNQLFLAYTGNVRDSNWGRHSFQLGAWMDKNGNITKIPTPLISSPPPGYTQEIRDPQLIAYDDGYLLIVGAQTEQKQGSILTYYSKDLQNWQFLGTLGFTEEEMGFMIECPNLLFVNGKALLVFCPQGLSHEIHSYSNIYPNTYVIGQTFDFEKNELSDPTHIKNIDEGFDIYATHCFSDGNGRTLAISWIGLPEISYPTDEEGWAHCLSIVKELTIEKEQLYQRPVKETAQLRKGKPYHFSGLETTIDAEINQYELQLEFDYSQKGTILLFADEQQKHGLTLSFDTIHGKMSMDRSHAGKSFAENFGTVREFSIEKKPLKLQIFVDRSVVEVFVNDGQQTATARVFPTDDQTGLYIKSDREFKGKLWHLRNMNK